MRVEFIQFIFLKYFSNNNTNTVLDDKNYVKTDT